MDSSGRPGRRSRRRDKRPKPRNSGRRAAFWQNLPGHAFEHELATLFERSGYQVERTPGSGDGGIDLVLRWSGQTTIVQCKQTTHPVGPAVARDLYGALVHFGADDGILATTGGVTAGVHSFFEGKPLHVMDLKEILVFHDDVLHCDEVERRLSDQAGD